jgi:VWFA-related protein
MFRHRLSFVLLIVIATLASVSVRAQEVEETIRIKTRVVFLDALVKDKKTNLPISNLAQENFEVLDDGKPRPISYFTREGEARKPLALILVLDLRMDGAGRFLKQPEILKAMENELAKLPPGDEVAIMAMNIGEDDQPIWLSDFTNDRTKIAAALMRVQQMCENPAAALAEAEAAAQSQKPAENAEAITNPKEVVSTEVIKGRNGATVTRKTMRDGSVSVQRTNKKGDVTVDFGETYDLSAAVRDATRKAQTLRPNSQVSLVWVSDGIVPIFFEDRDATEEIIIRDNVIFNALTVELRTLFKFLLPIGKPIAGWVGLSLYGSAKQLAQRSGGEAVKVGRVKDYGAGLSRIIGNLTARYSLGFTLAENETDDGRMHQLEVRVKAQDEKGKKRKLLVTSRQGYYMTETKPEATVRAQ